MGKDKGKVLADKVLGNTAADSKFLQYSIDPNHRQERGDQADSKLLISV